MLGRQRHLRRFAGTFFLGVAGATAATWLALVAQQPASHRQTFAAETQREFRARHLPYTVTAMGTDGAVLRIESPTLTKPFAEFLMRDSSRRAQLSQLGFAQVVFARDRKEGWTFNLGARGFH